MFGSHLSVAGGMVHALDAATELGFDTVQVFTKNQRQWRVPALKDNERRDWLKGLRDRGWESRTAAHATYLMNCASPDATLWRKSVDMMSVELERCAELSIPFLVAHPGAHLGSGVEAGCAAIARGVGPLLARGVGGGVVLCLENTAGGGSTLGRTFDELAMCRAMILDAAGGGAGRVGFCFDTCHALAAGYDLSAREGEKGEGRRRTASAARLAADRVLAEFDEHCGVRNLRVVHLNDSKGARGSHIDRHTHIGKGCVALGAFAAVVNHPALAGVPMILETPKEDDPRGRPWDKVNLAKLKRLLDKGD